MQTLDDESEIIKEKFETEESALPAFIKQFVENRRKHHTLAMKQEKSNELLFQ